MLCVKGFTGFEHPIREVHQFPHSGANHYHFGLPARRRCPKAQMSGLHRNAAIAGQYSALRTRALPIFDRRVRPRTLRPDSWCFGVRPRYAAAWRADWKRASGAISANRRVAVTVQLEARTTRFCLMAVALAAVLLCWWLR